MKILTLLIFVLLCSATRLSAQDLVITTAGDTLNCKITKYNKQYVYFIYKHENEDRKTLLPMPQVKLFIQNFFDQPEVTRSEYVTKPESQPFTYYFIDGGWGYQTGKVIETGSAMLENNMRKLKSGFFFKGGIQYYWNRNLGIGVEYSLFGSSGTLKDTYGQELRERVRLHYFGPTFNTRVPSANDRNALILSAGLGYLGFWDKAKGSTLSMTGSTLGISLAVGYDFGLSEKLAFGIKLAGVMGGTYKMKLKDKNKDYGTRSESLELEDGANFSHISLTVGLRLKGK